MEKINSRKVLENMAVVLILGVMFLLMLGSIWKESAIIDELAHIPAGFGYLRGDYRLNPEHPPLLKTLAAFSSWLMVRPNFPTDIPSWQNDVNGQWTQGATFLYESGNDADAIIFWARIPFLLLAVFFGWLLFHWTRKRFGIPVAFLTLIFFAFSPTFLTHSRFVTTDLGASFGFFIGIISFLWFLENQTWRNAALGGLVLGLAFLFKFSLAILIPIYAIMFLAWIATRPRLHLHERFRIAGRIFLKTALLGVTALSLIWVVYSFHVWDYPSDRQLHDSEFLLSSHPNQSLVKLDLALVKNPVTRPLAEYLLGFLMVGQRAAGGNTQFFMGEVSASGFRSYFPALYLLKEPLAFHVLTLVALWFSLWKFRHSENKTIPFWERIRAWIENNFAEFSALIFIALYWALSIASPLNIGIRHVLPTFPFIYLLVARRISGWLRAHELSNPSSWGEWLHNAYHLYIQNVPKFIFLGLALLWLVNDSVRIYPHFMTYYNELIAGPANGFMVAVDSNYDWGQDLIRLKEFVEKNKIEKIAIDYFGGGHPRYYFGGKFVEWNSARGPLSGWLAVSATFRQTSFGVPVHGFTLKPEDTYGWLKPYVPVARIGSIFVYKLP